MALTLMPDAQHATTSGLRTWGQGAHGQLGYGRRLKQDVTTPTAVTPLANVHIHSVACGHFHTAVVGGTGSSSAVYTWGRGALGLLGHGDEEDALVPRPVSALSGLVVRSVACGAYQTAAVTERGELFCWGWRLSRAGPGAIVEDYTTLPDKVHALAGLQVRHVSCGHYCSAATTTDGALYTWGKGDRGQLAHGDTRDVVDPERVRGGAVAGTFVWEASYGRHFLLALTAGGEVSSCGACAGGVLGRAPGRRLPFESGADHPAFDPTLRLISALRSVRVCALACGETHCAALSSEGEAYTWGTAAYGKLGHEDEGDCPEPRLVTPMLGKSLVGIACGAHSTLARDDGGQLWKWGASSAEPSPPTRLRLGGAACALGAGGGHCAVAVGEPLLPTADMALAREVGFVMPTSRAILSGAGNAAQAHAAMALVDAPIPADADPARIMSEVHALRGLLALEEARREQVYQELEALERQLQQVLWDEEMLRERRGGAEPPSVPAVAKGVALVDRSTYHSMLPEEQVEINLFGLKMGIAITSKP